MRSHSFLARAPRARRGLRSGFTLIEILVVIVIIAVLASVVGPEVFSKVGQAKTSTAKSQIEAISSALDAYRLDNGSYPTTQQGLDALYLIPSVDPPPTWRGPYMTKPVPLDPWNRPWNYAFPGTMSTVPGAYDLYTLGADGQPGGTGEDCDVTSWSLSQC